MTKTRRGQSALVGLIVAIVLGATGTSLAASVDFTNVAFAQADSQPTSIPIGHAEFCAKHRSECGVNTNVVAAEHLTDARWQELLNINTTVNTNVVAVSDEQLYKVSEYWTYPNGYGDCEDFALEKRRELMARGWPASTLLMTVVREHDGAGHAVLMVRTDRGDLILDNQDALVKLWKDTPYQYLKRQSQTNSAQWVDIRDSRPNQIATR